MRRQIVGWIVVLFASCCLAYGDTPGWDPGPAIQGPDVYVNNQWVTGDVTVHVGQIQFQGVGNDIDNLADPIDDDGVHCEWSYVPAGGGTSTNMGKSRGNSLCACPGYGTQVLEYPFNTAGAFNVTCKMDDCHNLADDPESKTQTFTLFCVDPCSFTEILVPPSQ